MLGKEQNSSEDCLEIGLINKVFVSSSQAQMLAACYIVIVRFTLYRKM